LDFVEIIFVCLLSQQNPKHNNNKNNPWVSHKHISSQQNTKHNNGVVIVVVVLWILLR
jgi:hypothetical protein